MRPSRSSVTLLCVCLAALLACKLTKRGKGTGSAPASASVGPSVVPQPIAPPSPSVAMVKPGELSQGLAYLAVLGSGIALMDHGRITLVLPLKYSVKRMTHGPDGSLWVAAIDGVFRVQGALNKKISAETGVDAIAATGAGELYTVSFSGIGHYAKGVWSSEDKKVLGDVTLLRDVAFDAEENVWILSTNAIHRKRKGTTAWETVEPAGGSGRKTFYNELARGPDGTLYASHSGGVLRLSAGEWKPLPSQSGLIGTSKIDVSPTGALAVTEGLGKLHVSSPGGGSARQLTLEGVGLSAKAIADVAVDGSGRIWLALDHGLAVLGPDGQKLIEWDPGTLEGVSGNVTHLVLVGNGPGRLPSAGEAVTGTVVGRVIRGGSAVTGAEIEICNSPAMLFRRTPCGDKPFKMTSKTDTSGQFRFAGVPVGNYGFAIHTKGGKWLTTLVSDCCTGMKKGQEYDVGSLRLKE